jgi:cob(I)alamin adenosyltransferase
MGHWALVLLFCTHVQGPGPGAFIPRMLYGIYVLAFRPDFPLSIGPTMKLYTRTGDDGTTGLFGGDRVGKDHPVIEVVGTVDEANAMLGLTASALDLSRPLHARLGEMIGEIQARLFDLGADLATPLGSTHEDKIVRLSEAQSAQLEKWIDEIDAGNDAMRQFVLPGGTELAARLHVARTVCRRAERRVTVLTHVSNVNPHVIIVLNRLSDLLFAMARRVNKDAGVPDVPWTPAKRG